MMKRMMITRKMIVRKVNMLKIQNLKKIQIRMLFYFNILAASGVVILQKYECKNHLLMVKIVHFFYF